MERNYDADAQWPHVVNGRRPSTPGRLFALQTKSRACYLVLLLVVATLLSQTVATSAQDRNPRLVSDVAGTPSLPKPALDVGFAGDADPNLYAAVLPDQRDRIYANTAGKLSRYRIEASVVPAESNGPALVSGTVQVRYVNETTRQLRHVFFRLYPNAPVYNEAAMTVSTMSVAGLAVQPELSLDDTVLRVPLPDQLAPGHAIDLDLAFSAVVPVRPTRTYGIFAVDPDSGTIALAHWFPLLAGYDEFGWSLDPVSRNGDPIFSNTALFDVTFSTPEGWQVAATGTEVETVTMNGTTSRRLISGPVRDFTVVTSNRFKSVSQVVAGTTVTSFYLPEDEAGGEAVLTYAARALEIFNSFLPPYPYRQMVLAEVELYGAGGVEFPQMMMMGKALYGDDNRRNEHYLEFVTAHEVAHQWFYALVGNNQHLDAYIDEGLVQYLSSDVYFSAEYGPDTGRRQYGLEVLMWYLGALQSRGDTIVDQPTDDFESAAAYSTAGYAKGAIGFAEIRRQIGDDAFFAALRQYATDYEFGIGTPPALLQAFEAASDQDVAATWEYWFEEENGRDFFSDEDFNELQIELGLR